MEALAIPVGKLNRKCGIPDGPILSNVRSAIRRGLPTFRSEPPHDRTVAICGGGPSIAGCLDEIRALQAGGHEIWTVNRCYDYLAEAGIVADVCVLLDMDPRIAECCRNPRPRTAWLVGSQCAPETFDALEGQNVVLWHGVNGDLADAHVAVCREEGHKCLLIGGGTTAALRAIPLAILSGAKTIRAYGMDSSFEDKSHIYEWFLEADEKQILFNGRFYRTTLGMIEQAQRFLDAAETFPGVSFSVHGGGYLFDLWQHHGRSVAA